MANIRWDNVPIPDYGATQARGTALASQMLQNATASASSAVTTYEKLLADQKAATQQAADRFVLENMLSTQDPTKYNQMRADGSLLGPAAGQVSNATLQAAEKRSGELYDLDRTRTRNRELQAAEAIWDQASRVAVNNPTEAQKIIGTAQFSNAEDAAAFSQKARQLYVDPDKAGTESRRKETQTRASILLAERVMKAGNASPETQQRILSTEADPLIRGMAVDYLNRQKEDTNPYYSSALTPDATPSKGFTDGPEDAMFKHYGNNMVMGMRSAGPQNPPPGTAEWNAQNGGRPITQADVADWSDKYVLPGSEAELGEGKGTTAIGPYQIVNKTRRDFINRKGKSLFGTNDMFKIPFTPENEEKLARAIYNEQKSGAWAATKKYPGLADGKAFEGVPWNDAKGILAYIDGGVAPRSFNSEIQRAGTALQERENALTDSQKVILNAEAKKNYGLNEAAADVTKALGGDTKVGEVQDVINNMVRKAKDAGTVITHAEAAGLLLNNITQDKDVISGGIFRGRVPTLSDLRDDLDLKESDLMDQAKDLGNARKDLEGYRKNLDSYKRMQELAVEYQNAGKAAKSQLINAQNSADAGKSAINAFAVWQSTSDKLRRLVAPKPESGVSITLVDDARPGAPNQSRAEPVNQQQRPVDINLMLNPSPQASPEDDWKSRYLQR